MFEVLEIPVKKRAPGAGVKTNPVYTDIVDAAILNKGKAVLVPNEVLPSSMTSKGKGSIVKILRARAEKMGLAPTEFASKRMESGMCIWVKVKDQDPFQA